MWQGFLKESKLFMSYNNRTWFRKLEFWAAYPFAYFAFCRTNINSGVKEWYR